MNRNTYQDDEANLLLIPHIGDNQIGRVLPRVACHVTGVSQSRQPAS